MSNPNFAQGFQKVLEKNQAKKIASASKNVGQILSDTTISEPPIVKPKPIAQNNKPKISNPEPTPPEEIPAPVISKAKVARPKSAHKTATIALASVFAVLVVASIAGIAIYSLQKPTEFIGTTELSNTDAPATNNGTKTQPETPVTPVDDEDKDQQASNSENQGSSDDTNSQNSNDEQSQNKPSSQDILSNNSSPVSGIINNSSNNNDHVGADSRTGASSNIAERNSESTNSNSNNNSNTNSSSSSSSSQSDSSNSNSNSNNSSNSNNNSNQQNLTPSDHETTIAAYFHANGASFTGDNGATVIRSCKISKNRTSCTVTVPEVSRDGYTILGFSDSPETHEATIETGSNITISSTVDFYVISQKDVVATFVYPKGGDPETQSCTYFNTDRVGCKISFPSYEQPGSFEKAWSRYEDLSGAVILSGNSETIYENTTYYASYHHPSYRSCPYTDSDGDKVYLYCDRDLEIQRIYWAGPAKFEYQAGIPEDVINAHIAFLDTAYATTPWVFVPSKNFVLMPETYREISLAYGVTYGPWSWSWNNIDIQYDRGSGKISENATIHELAHAWDAYYSYRTGRGYIRNQSDLKALYDDLKAQGKVKDLTIVEWFAGTSTEYYWHYLGMNTSEPSFAGWKDSMNDEEKARYVEIYDRFVNDYRNDYVIISNHSSIFASSKDGSTPDLYIFNPFESGVARNAAVKRAQKQSLRNVRRD